MPPLNLVGDFGGGGMLLAFGIVCALLEAQRSGTRPGGRRRDDRGRVAADDDVLGHARGASAGASARGDNVLDSGAPWYDTYETRDGKYIAVGAIEPKFYAELLQRLGLAGEALPDQHDRAGWPALRERFAAVIRTRTRDEWSAAFDGSDACVAPVLTFPEALAHPHNVARRGHVSVGGIDQPAPAPRFSRTSGEVRARRRDEGNLGIRPSSTGASGPRKSSVCVRSAWASTKRRHERAGPLPARIAPERAAWRVVQ